jgi:hypothetical protein
VKDDHSFGSVLTDFDVDCPLHRAGWTAVVMPDPQTFVPCDLGEHVVVPVDLKRQVGPIRVVPTQFLNEKRAELLGINELQ